MIITQVADFNISISVQCDDGRPLSLREQRKLQELEAKLLLLCRRGHHLENADRNCCPKVSKAVRPLKVCRLWFHLFFGSINYKSILYLFLVYVITVYSGLPKYSPPSHPLPIGFTLKTGIKMHFWVFVLFDLHKLPITLKVVIRQKNRYFSVHKYMQVSWGMSLLSSKHYDF